MDGLLSSKRRKALAFFSLSVTTGMPFGFTSTALATQMRRANVSTAEIGAIVSLLYLPWAFKWLFGPVIDLFYSERLGRRRGWIVGLQLLMTAMLLWAMPIDLTHTERLFSLELHVPGSDRVWLSFAPSLFAFVILLHNTFGAMQGVAIDALACGVLSEQERGTVGGFMTAGIYTGIAIGGAGVLYVSDVLAHFGVPAMYAFLVPVTCLLSITLLVSLRLREGASDRARPPHADGRLRGVATQLGGYVRDASRALLGSWTARLALIAALLPMGAQAFALGWRSTLAVELGMSDSAAASLALVAELLSAGSCVIGGYLSDRFGRRRMLMVYILALAPPNLVLAYVFHHHGLSPAPGLIPLFWVCNIVFSVLQGFYSGTRVALFMDLCTPSVAATQFSAYVSLNSFGSGVLAALLGRIVARWGYPSMLVLDAALGLVCAGIVPFLKPVARTVAADAVVEANNEVDVPPPGAALASEIEL
jgi:PAT family beta-lactamase induction signal transducer AmpG